MASGAEAFGEHHARKPRKARRRKDEGPRVPDGAPGLHRCGPDGKRENKPRSGREERKLSPRPAGRSGAERCQVGGARKKREKERGELAKDRCARVREDGKEEGGTTELPHDRGRGGKRRDQGRERHRREAVRSDAAKLTEDRRKKAPGRRGGEERVHARQKRRHRSLLFSSPTALTGASSAGLPSSRRTSCAGCSGPWACCRRRAWRARFRDRPP